MVHTCCFDQGGCEVCREDVVLACLLACLSAGSWVDTIAMNGVA
jgi:hypothetical protein